MKEFELIESILASLNECSIGSDIEIGPGDDAAVLNIPPGRQLVISTDNSVEGVHFPKIHPLSLLVIGRLLLVFLILQPWVQILSAAPLLFTLPKIEPDWADGFVKGLLIASKEYESPIVGGNIARGELNVCITVQGTVEKGLALRRSNSKVGDDVWVTGRMGATRVYLAEPRMPKGSIEALLQRRDSDA